MRGMPPRGSAQDLIATEMIRRERTAFVAQQEYLARMFQVGLNIPEKIFKVWTDLFSMEVFQDSYSPAMIRMQRQALEAFDRKKQQEARDRRRMFNRLATLEVKSDSLRTATPKEREELKNKLRRARMQKPR